MLKAIAIFVAGFFAFLLIIAAYVTLGSVCLVRDMFEKEQ